MQLNGSLIGFFRIRQIKWKKTGLILSDHTADERNEDGGAASFFPVQESPSLSQEQVEDCLDMIETWIPISSDDSAPVSFQCYGPAPACREGGKGKSELGFPLDYFFEA